ncbi:hypothetical protein LCGC14_1254320 [marine sediment metagenome]|uniref:Uncharacterized protein n=1 Tax=marine sediment metagenome TaxID=412755 RepID=A0A0F9L5H1_9ZZZZ
MSHNKETRFLYIFYFDQVEGPKLFFSKSEFNPFDSILIDMLLGYGGGEKPFPIAFEDFQTLNFRFYISSKFARSGFEEFMITFLVNEPYIDNFKSLKLKSQIIKEFAHELKNLKEFPKILSEKRKFRKEITELGYKRFNDTLLGIYNKYYALLALPFAGKPKKEVIANLKKNIKSEILIYIVHACLFKKNLLILIKKEVSHLIPDLNKFTDYIFQKSFTGKILIKSKSQYKKNRQLYEEYIVMEEKELIKKTRKLINSNQLKYETKIVRKFYNNTDNSLNILNLKERLEGIYIFTKHMFNFYERKDNNKPLSPKIVVKHLEETLSVKKIRKEYLYFLTDVIREYFGLTIIWLWDKLGEKIDGLWKLN